MFLTIFLAFSSKPMPKPHSQSLMLLKTFLFLSAMLLYFSNTFPMNGKPITNLLAGKPTWKLTIDMWKVLISSFLCSSICNRLFLRKRFFMYVGSYFDRDSVKIFDCVLFIGSFFTRSHNQACTSCFPICAVGYILSIKFLVWRKTDSFLWRIKYIAKTFFTHEVWLGKSPRIIKYYWFEAVKPVFRPLCSTCFWKFLEIENWIELKNVLVVFLPVSEAAGNEMERPS